MTFKAETPRGADLIRQIGVISSTCFMIIAAAVGTGLLGGTSVQDLLGGSLDSDGSFVAPARSAFSIWSVIYLFTIVYTVWQALPSQRANSRQRALGWWIAAANVFNGLWLVAAQFFTLQLTVVAIGVLLITLGIAFHRAVTHPTQRVAEAYLIDGTIGLHLGWVSVATVTNVAAFLTFTGPNSWGAHPQVWGAAVIALVVVVATGIGWASRWRVTPALAIAWGLVWIAVARTWEQPRAEWVALAAIIAAVLVLVPPIAVRVVRYVRSLPA